MKGLTNQPWTYYKNEMLPLFHSQTNKQFTPDGLFSAASTSKAHTWKKEIEKIYNFCTV